MGGSHHIMLASLIRRPLWEYVYSSVGWVYTHDSAFWCVQTAGPQEVCVPVFSSFLSVSSRVKLVPPVLVVLKALKVLGVNLALLGPLGLLVPL